MIQRCKTEKSEVRAQRWARQSGGFRSHREFLIYLGWLRLFHKVYEGAPEPLEMAIHG
jgi:hypothetical protein